MPDVADKLLEDEGSDVERAVDDAIRQAGSERAAIRSLIALLENAERNVSLGYRRGLQPPRPAP
ncbi:hypothetical protein [Chenggangzhangella methanolivorans]|uniref:Uncharacterized protein n=1 Tax=Chenggangzhangella methanolivorans TaxID=1437009 RepID=A0A9E6RD96_9HYPH|nr:hypothetical protein [Chenggangzhangella methanolivorans]QZO01725.1 hypothetical protein K6K41_10295 [Chenggangzhangella methanolivorans]